MCCTYVLHSSVGTKCISNLCWPNPNHISEDTKCGSKRVNQTIQQGQKMNVNTLSWDRVHQMYHNCWPNPTQTREGTKPISIYASYASEDNQFQYVLIKPYPFQRWNMSPHACEDTKCISIRDDPKHPMLDRTKNVSKYVSTKTPTLPARTQCISQQELTKTSNAREFAICDSKCVDQTPHVPAKTENDSQNVFTKILPSQHVLNKPLPCQGRHKMHLNLLESIYLYFPPSSQLLYLWFCPVGLSLL